MAVIVLVEDLPSWLFVTLATLVGVLMLVALAGYVKTFLGARKALPQKETNPKN